MVKRRHRGAVLAACLAAVGVAMAAPQDPFASVTAHIAAASHAIAPGDRILLDFTLRNHADAPVVLGVPDVTAEPGSAVSGLPLAHVFSGQGFTALTIRSDYQRTWTESFGYEPAASAPEIVLGPRAIVGVTVDITEFYPQLRTPGLYRLVWQPYGGLLASNQLTLNIAPLKEAQILTDHGTMRMALKYKLAPGHVANFIELARSGFYNQKTVHRIVPGYFLQAGCPNGDGTGIRLDGKKLAAEFSDYPIDRGTLCMARLEDDPDSGSCQFLIANTRMHDWDGRYSVFGQLVGEESMNTLEKIMALEVDEDGRPNRTLYIRAVRIVDAPVSAPVDPRAG